MKLDINHHISQIGAERVGGKDVAEKATIQQTTGSGWREVNKLLSLMKWSQPRKTSYHL
jgi:hypothetical protein